MSDYFHNIAALTLGLMPRLRLASASRFGHDDPLLSPHTLPLGQDDSWKARATMQLASLPQDSQAQSEGLLASQSNAFTVSVMDGRGRRDHRMADKATQLQKSAADGFPPQGSILIPTSSGIEDFEKPVAQPEPPRANPVKTSFAGVSEPAQISPDDDLLPGAAGEAISVEVGKPVVEPLFPSLRRDLLQDPQQTSARTVRNEIESEGKVYTEPNRPNKPPASAGDNDEASGYGSQIISVTHPSLKPDNPKQLENLQLQASRQMSAIDADAENVDPVNREIASYVTTTEVGEVEQTRSSEGDNAFEAIYPQASPPMQSHVTNSSTGLIRPSLRGIENADPKLHSLPSAVVPPVMSKRDLPASRYAASSRAGENADLQQTRPAEVVLTAASTNLAIQLADDQTQKPEGEVRSSESAQPVENSLVRLPLSARDALTGRTTPPELSASSADTRTKHWKTIETAPTTADQTRLVTRNFARENRKSEAEAHSPEHPQLAGSNLDPIQLSTQEEPASQAIPSQVAASTSATQTGHAVTAHFSPANPNETVLATEPPNSSAGWIADRTTRFFEAKGQAKEHSQPEEAKLDPAQLSARDVSIELATAVESIPIPERNQTQRELSTELRPITPEKPVLTPKSGTWSRARIATRNGASEAEAHSPEHPQLAESNLDPIQLSTRDAPAGQPTPELSQATVTAKPKQSDTSSSERIHPDEAVLTTESAMFPIPPAVGTFRSETKVRSSNPAYSDRTLLSTPSVHAPIQPPNSDEGRRSSSEEQANVSSTASMPKAEPYKRERVSGTGNRFEVRQLTGLVPAVSRMAPLAMSALMNMHINPAERSNVNQQLSEEIVSASQPTDSPQRSLISEPTARTIAPSVSAKDAHNDPSAFTSTTQTLTSINPTSAQVSSSGHGKLHGNNELPAGGRVQRSVVTETPQAYVTTPPRRYTGAARDAMVSSGTRPLSSDTISPHVESTANANRRYSAWTQSSDLESEIARRSQFEYTSALGPAIDRLEPNDDKLLEPKLWTSTASMSHRFRSQEDELATFSNAPMPTARLLPGRVPGPFPNAKVKPVEQAFGASASGGTESRAQPDILPTIPQHESVGRTGYEPTAAESSVAPIEATRIPRPDILQHKRTTAQTMVYVPAPTSSKVVEQIHPPISGDSPILDGAAIGPRWNRSNSPREHSGSLATVQVIKAGAATSVAAKSNNPPRSKGEYQSETIGTRVHRKESGLVLGTHTKEFHPTMPAEAYPTSSADLANRAQEAAPFHDQQLETTPTSSTTSSAASTQTQRNQSISDIIQGTAASPLSRKPPQEALPSSVRVTIGRVDFGDAPTTPKRVQSGRPTPKLTLQTYLKRIRGGL